MDPFSRRFNPSLLFRAESVFFSIDTMNAQSFHRRRWRLPLRGTLLRLSLAWMAAMAGTPSFAEENPDVPPDAAWRAARNGLGGLVSRALADRPEWYGFPPDVAVEDLRLDAPWRQYALPPAAVLKPDPSLSLLDEILQATDTWFFPVVRQDSSQALLAVHFTDGEWRAGALGYAGLARELERVRAQWPEKRGYHARLVTSFQARRHLFTVPEADAPNLTLLKIHPSSAAPLPDYRRLGAPVPVLKELQADVRANLDAYPAGGAP